MTEEQYKVLIDAQKKIFFSYHNVATFPIPIGEKNINKQQQHSYVRHR